MAGGNHVLSVLGSPAAGMSGGMGPSQPVAAGPAQVQSTQGTTADLGHVQIAVGALFVLSLLALVVLNKAGFRFSATIG